MSHGCVFRGGWLAGGERHVVGHRRRAAIKRNRGELVDIAEDRGRVEDALPQLPIAVPVAALVVRVLPQARPPVSIGLIPIPADGIVAREIVRISEREVIVPNRCRDDLRVRAAVFVKIGGQPVAVDLLRDFDKPPVVDERIDVDVGRVAEHRVAEVRAVECIVEGVDVVAQIRRLRGVENSGGVGVHSHGEVRRAIRTRAVAAEDVAAGDQVGVGREIV